MSKAAEACKRWRLNNPESYLASARRQRNNGAARKYRKTAKGKLARLRACRRAQGCPEPLWECIGICECCRSTNPGSVCQVFQLDHDHVTGQFRGWLCGRCNRGIGLLGDNTHGVRLALEYLEDKR